MFWGVWVATPQSPVDFGGLAFQTHPPQLWLGRWCGIKLLKSNVVFPTPLALRTVNELAYAIIVCWYCQPLYSIKHLLNHIAENI